MLLNPGPVFRFTSCIIPYSLRHIDIEPNALCLPFSVHHGLWHSWAMTVFSSSCFMLQKSAIGADLMDIISVLTQTYNEFAVKKDCLAPAALPLLTLFSGRLSIVFLSNFFIIFTTVKCYFYFSGAPAA